VAAPAATTTPEVAPALPQPESSAPEPEAALRIDVEELPPESKPSGIGEKYIPKEEGAPPVVLNDDVRAAELGAQAQLEAQHRARRAPTIARLKAIELPSTLVDAEPPLARRKSGIGWLLASACSWRWSPGRSWWFLAASPAPNTSSRRAPR